MTAAKRANLQSSIAIGAAIGASQGIFRAVAESHGTLVGLAAGAFFAAAVAVAASWLVGRLIQSSDA